MDSQTVIVSPSQVNAFADALEESAKRLKNHGRKFRDSADAARVVWKDEKYCEFNKHLSECLAELDKFCRTSASYTDFLREKALRAEKYLHGR